MWMLSRLFTMNDEKIIVAFLNDQFMYCSYYKKKMSHRYCTYVQSAFKVIPAPEVSPIRVSLRPQS